MSKNVKSRELKKGWSTGACAAAASKAAYKALLSGAFPSTISIDLPSQSNVKFSLSSHHYNTKGAQAGIIKDAGDDPDVTHGVEIIAHIHRNEKSSGFHFFAGPGVGTVTKPGLILPPGEPAINPKPREYIIHNLTQVAKDFGDSSGLDITLSIPNGEKIAQETWNPQLGILKGLSILGTTGVVIPYSCSAWIHSIHRGIDVAHANGIEHMVACTGKTSQQCAMNHYQLDPWQIIDMGDFAGGMLKYMRKKPPKKLTLCGGIGKMTKLAQGHLNLHSNTSRINFSQIQSWAKQVGLAHGVCQDIAKAQSASHVMDMCKDKAPDLAFLIGKHAQDVVRATLAGAIHIDLMIIDQKGTLLAHVT